MTAKLPHECGVCGSLFKTSREHIFHVMEHKIPHTPRAQMHRRKVSCWRCAKEMPVPEGDNPYSCECGFVLPPKLNQRDVNDKRS